jgi:hypothetical protein
VNQPYVCDNGLILILLEDEREIEPVKSEARRELERKERIIRLVTHVTGFVDLYRV